MPKTLEFQKALMTITGWSQSDDCPYWGRSIVQRCLALIAQIHIQRELGRHEAMDEDWFVCNQDPLEEENQSG